ncbi:hypothetical protein [Qiania dongpingensis]|uniref:Uncharacterized protein n=1 Tax=Qiania dongpingensis TaxID=2763669 RepID=A0A7G9G563_9FIRM|nr:hypothetical protein [Qiania dongpingensis]QNM05945.1 hypothetical protein H9Q78_01870 [Qiania dongpingensis]
MDIRSFSGIKGTEIIRKGAAGRIPAERFRSGDKAAFASPANRNRDGQELLPVSNWGLAGTY